MHPLEMTARLSPLILRREEFLSAFIPFQILAGRTFLMRFFQVNDFAGLSRRFFWFIEPSDPTLHVGAALEQVGKFLSAVLADLTQLLKRIQFHRR